MFSNIKKATGFIMVLTVCLGFTGHAAGEVSVWQQSVSVTSKMLYPSTLDDFNDGSDPNNWGGYKSMGASNQNIISTATYDSVSPYGGSGYCLKIKFNVPNSGDYSTMYMPLRPDWSGVNVATYTYLSIMVKGTGAEKSFKMQLIDSNGTGNSIYIVNYSTITANWQEIKIPFSAFSTVDFTKLSQMNCSFEYDYLNLHGWPFTGTVYIDNIMFKYN